MILGKLASNYFVFHVCLFASDLSSCYCPSVGLCSVDNTYIINETVFCSHTNFGDPFLHRSYGVERCYAMRNCIRMHVCLYVCTYIHHEVSSGTKARLRSTSFGIHMQVDNVSSYANFYRNR